MDEMLKLAFVLIWVLMLPVVLVVATPVILMWPRDGLKETLGRTVLRRYGRILGAAMQVF